MNFPIELFCNGCESTVAEFETEEKLQADLKHRGMEEKDIEREEDMVFINCGGCHKYGSYCNEC
jgi:hypothetical protein